MDSPPTAINPYQEILQSPQALCLILDEQKQIFQTGLGILRASPNPIWKPGFQEIQDLVPFRTILEGFGAITFLPVQKQVNGNSVWILSGCKESDPQDLQKNMFLSYVVHELRTPISALFSWSELLTKNMLDKPTEISEAHQILFNESMRLSEYLTKLLHFFRLETGRTVLDLKPCNLNDIMNQCLIQLRELGDHHQVSLFFEEATELQAFVKADAALLQVAVANILENAILYSGESKEVEIQQRVENGFGVLEIHDEGIGFPMELLSKILQAYHTAIPQLTTRNGIGLGLPTAERIIQLHRGTLEISPRTPKGTSVKVSLPLA